MQRFFVHDVLGTVVLEGNAQQGLAALKFHQAIPQALLSDDPLLVEVENLLHQYLAGDVTVDWSWVPLSLHGTPFQKSVWQALTTIPVGETRSYQWVAHQVGSPKAVRAVGQANGKNPIPIIIPCHRVVESSGNLGGYTGGLDIKRFLLQLEQPVYSMGMAVAQQPGLLV